MNYQPGYHKIDPGQKCRILTIQVAVPANAHPSDIADEMTGLLTTAIADEQSNVLDWQYAPPTKSQLANLRPPTSLGRAGFAIQGDHMTKKRAPDILDIMFANPATTIEQAGNIVQARRRRRTMVWAAIVVAVILLLAAICLTPTLTGG